MEGAHWHAAESEPPAEFKLGTLRNSDQAPRAQQDPQLSAPAPSLPVLGRRVTSDTARDHRARAFKVPAEAPD